MGFDQSITYTQTQHITPPAKPFYCWITNTPFLSEFSSSHGGKYEDESLLEYSTM
jgi:hypothetical protein